MFHPPSFLSKTLVEFCQEAVGEDSVVHLTTQRMFYSRFPGFMVSTLFNGFPIFNDQGNPIAIFVQDDEVAQSASRIQGLVDQALSRLRASVHGAPPQVMIVLDGEAAAAVIAEPDPAATVQAALANHLYIRTAVAQGDRFMREGTGEAYEVEFR